MKCMDCGLYALSNGDYVRVVPGPRHNDGEHYHFHYSWKGKLVSTGAPKDAAAQWSYPLTTAEMDGARSL